MGQETAASNSNVAPGAPSVEGTDETITGGYPTMSRTRAIVLVLSLTLGMVQNAANAVSATIALPSIGKSLDIEESQLQWIISAYSLSSGCLLIFFGRLADLYGRKRAFMLGIVVTSVFSLACGFVKDALTLDILRGIQGIGAGATVPASLGILAQSFPPSRARSVAFATFAAGAPVGGAFGMTIGGALTQLTRPGWRSTFFFIAAIGVVCLVGGAASIGADPPLRQRAGAAPEVDRRVDWLGALLVTAGLVLIVFVLSDGETAPHGWQTGYIIALLILGVALLVAFVFWQGYLGRAALTGRTRLPPPLMRLSLWTRAHGKLAAMMVVAFLNWCCFVSWQFWAQLYYQQYLGLTPVLTMVRMLPMFVTGVLVNVVFALVAGRVDVALLAVTGTLFTGAATLFFALIDTSAPYWAYGFPSAIFSVVGADFVFASGTLFVAKVAAPDEQSLAGATFQTMTQLGTSFGLTISTIVYDRVAARTSSAHDDPRAGQLAGYRAAQWTSFGFGMLASLIIVLFLRGVGIVGHKNTPGAAPSDKEKVSHDEHESGHKSQVAPAAPGSVP